MKQQVAMSVAYATAAGAMVLTVALSLSIARQQFVAEQQDRAALLAREALRRSEILSTQVIAGIRALNAEPRPAPCSPADIQRMLAAVARQDMLYDLGYVRNDQLVCSSLGLIQPPFDIGPVELRTASEFDVRRRVTFPTAPDTTFRVVVDPKTHYAGVLHAELGVDVAADDPEVRVGVVLLRNRQVLYERGGFELPWLDRLGEQARVQFVDAGRVVALRRSSLYDYAVYVAFPLAAHPLVSQRLAWVLSGLGLGTGLGLAVAIVRLTRRAYRLPARLRRAIRGGRLTVVYQPVVELETGRWVGAEALVRWHEPDAGPISPEVFIAVAEQHGLIAELSQLVIGRSLEEAAALLRARPDFYIAVNLSSVDFESGAIVRQIEGALRAAGLGGRSLAVEATERVFLDTESTRATLRGLHALGVRVAIDDFGTGYSSLAYLARLEIDCLKIDKSFVETIDTESATSQVVAHIIEMGKSMRLALVAEGVETSTQADYLRAHGVGYAQGWLFARPMPMSELAQALDAAG